MTTRTLREEIRQAKPFGSLEQEAMLNIERTSAVLGHRMAEMMRDFGVTPTQYNVLRILRGAGGEGLCRHAVRDRLIAQVPDVTRLLDRLAEMGLVERERSADDRRMVHTRITDAGIALLARMDEPVQAFHREVLGHLSQEQLRTLIDVLTVARQSG
jgi:DNA-binding MarR family transcriptional regulator